MWAQRILSEDYEVVNELRSGNYFGERACLQGALRSASVVSMKYTETLTLTKAALDDVAELFPDASTTGAREEHVPGGDSFQEASLPMHAMDASPG